MIEAQHYLCFQPFHAEIAANEWHLVETQVRFGFSVFNPPQLYASADRKWNMGQSDQCTESYLSSKRSEQIKGNYPHKQKVPHFAFDLYQQQNTIWFEEEKIEGNSAIWACWKTVDLIGGDDKEYGRLMLDDNDNDNDNFHDDDNLASTRTLTDLNGEDVGEYNYLTMVLTTMMTTNS